MDTQYNPEGDPNAANRDTTWPRIYAQNRSDGYIVELARGPLAAHEQRMSSLAGEFGPGWIVLHVSKRRGATPNYGIIPAAA